MADDQTQGMDPSGTTLPQLPGMSQDQLARRRAMAQALISQGVDFSPVQSKWQGAARLADALVGSLQMYGADKAESQGRQQIINALSKGGDISTVGKALAASPYGSQTGIDLLTQNLINQNKPHKLMPYSADQSILDTTTGKTVVQGTPKIDADTKKAIAAADTAAGSGQDFIDSMNTALELNDKAYSAFSTMAPSSAISGKAALESLTGGEGPATKTMQLNNVVQNAAVQQFRQLFGPRATQRELQVLFDIKGSTDKPAAVRKDIYNRAIKIAQEKIDSNKAQAAALRGGTYYGAGGATPAATAAPPVPGATQMNVSAAGNARPFPTYDILQNLKAHAADPAAKQTFDKYYGAGAADHFLAGGQ
jgi:hypothetical protein